MVSAAGRDPSFQVRWLTGASGGGLSLETFVFTQHSRGEMEVVG